MSGFVANEVSTLKRNELIVYLIQCAVAVADLRDNCIVWFYFLAR